MPESRDSRDSRDAVDEVARTPEHPVADDRASRQRIEVTHGASVVPVPPAPDVRPPGPEGAYVGQPAKVMRIGTMVKQLLEEVRSAPLDEAARSRLAAVHDRSLRELEDGLSPDLVAELRRITLPFSDETNPSESELRVAQAQLVGWLEGLFHGL
ncbi:MAG TPA: proteasome activator, partial [Actinotalea sp.]